jgi:hypothetical protein
LQYNELTVTTDHLKFITTPHTFVSAGEEHVLECPVFQVQLILKQLYVVSLLPRVSPDGPH